MILLSRKTIFNYELHFLECNRNNANCNRYLSVLLVYYVYIACASLGTKSMLTYANDKIEASSSINISYGLRMYYRQLQKQDIMQCKNYVHSTNKYFYLKRESMYVYIFYIS